MLGKGDTLKTKELGEMGKVKYTTEQIIVKLREAEVLCSQGKTVAKQHGKLALRNKPTTVGARNTAG